MCGVCVVCIVALGVCAPLCPGKGRALTRESPSCLVLYSWFLFCFFLLHFIRPLSLSSSPSRMTKLTHAHARCCRCRRPSKTHHRFFTSLDHPSMPSPLLPTSRPDIRTSLMPSVSANHSCDAMPPAFARLSGMSSSIGVRKSATRLASRSSKWYFSFNTSGSAQWRRRWMFRSSPLRVKISWDHLPDRQRALGNGPRSSMICAM